MKTKTKVAVAEPFYSLCEDCGDELYPRADKKKMIAITVSIGTCGRCGTNKKYLIPIRDWKYASGYPGYMWD